MRLRPLLAAFCLLLTLSVGSAAPALAQDDPGAALSDLEKALGEATGSTPGAEVLPDGGASASGSGGDDQPIPDLPSPSTPVEAPAGTTPAPASGSVTPSPPGYLVPGQSAAVQPVSGVAGLTEPDLPLEPLRIAALIALALAALLVGGAAAVRGLGWRTAVRSPVKVAPAGRFSRVRERTGLLADDVRDFLRHQR